MAVTHGVSRWAAVGCADERRGWVEAKERGAKEADPAAKGYSAAEEL